VTLLHGLVTVIAMSDGAWLYVGVIAWVCLGALILGSKAGG
jgi:hypothetical protein